MPKVPISLLDCKMLGAHQVTRNAHLLRAFCAPFVGDGLLLLTPPHPPPVIMEPHRAHLQLLRRNILGILTTRAAEKLHQRRHRTPTAFAPSSIPRSPSRSIFISKPPSLSPKPRHLLSSQMQAGTPLPVPDSARPTPSAPRPCRSVGGPGLLRPARGALTWHTRPPTHTLAAWQLQKLAGQ